MCYSTHIFCQEWPAVSIDMLFNVYSDYEICIMILFLILIDGYKRQIEDFFKFINGIKDHFIQHIIIVFPNITFDELTKESKSIEGKYSLSLSLSYWLSILLFPIYLYITVYGIK